MQKIRITANPNPNDPSEELRRLAIVRRDLYTHPPVEVDPDSPAHRTRRDEQQRAFFEFSTKFVDEVKRVIKEHGHETHVSIQEIPGAAGEPCIKCGFEHHGATPTVCPNCKFREISACPHCGEEVPRQNYESIAGDLFRCPHCMAFVRLHFNEPLMRSDGSYNEPVVLVEEEAGQTA